MQHRVRLDLVPTNVGGRAAELGDVLLLELYILKGREAREPAAVGDEDAFGDPGAADGAGELCPLVGSGHLEQHFGIEVLLFEALYERDGIIRRGAQHHDIGVCLNDLVSDRVPVGDLGGIGNFLESCLHPSAFQQTLGGLDNRLQVGVLFSGINCSRGTR